MTCNRSRWNLVAVLTDINMYSKSDFLSNLWGFGSSPLALLLLAVALIVLAQWIRCKLFLNKYSLSPRRDLFSREVSSNVSLESNTVTYTKLAPKAKSKVMPRPLRMCLAAIFLFIFGSKPKVNKFLASRKSIVDLVTSLFAPDVPTINWSYEWRKDETSARTDGDQRLLRPAIPTVFWSATRRQLCGRSCCCLRNNKMALSAIYREKTKTSSNWRIRGLSSFSSNFAILSSEFRMPIWKKCNCNCQCWKWMCLCIMYQR